MSKTVTLRAMGDAIHRERHLEEEQWRYEAKRIKAERYGDSDAPSPYMVSCFIGDIKATAVGILTQLTRLQEKGDQCGVDQHLAEACHILAEAFSSLARVEKNAKRKADFVPFEERFGKESK